MEEYILRYILSDLTNGTKVKLLQMYNNEENIYNNIDEIINLKSININIKNKLKNIDYSREQRFKQYLLENCIEYVTINDKKYPEKLRNIKEPPYVIFYKGDISLLYENMVAVVGSRKCTVYGMEVTKFLVNEICKVDFGVVSGVAYGIDTMAHKETLRNHGKTIGVLGCGLDVVYPKSNKKLYEEIYNNGLLISEFIPGTKPESYNFPRRNRIISGLAKGVIVVEASIKSGSLITANYALDQGKDVLAIPGSIFSNTSKGCHQLLKDGATFYSSIEDLYSFLNITKNDKIKKQKNYNENIVKSIISDQPIHFDKIFKSVNIDRIALYELLFEMQNQNEIICLPGNYYVKLS